MFLGNIIILLLSVPVGVIGIQEGDNIKIGVSVLLIFAALVIEVLLRLKGRGNKDIR